MNLPLMNLSGILAAIILLFLGRKFFWFFVGVVGFVYGSGVVVQYFHSIPPLISLLIGAVCGVVCALIAPFFQRILAALVGFITGGYAGVWLFVRLTPAGGEGIWIVYLAGGFLGFLLAWLLLDASLIVLSALLGAALLIESLPFSTLVSQMAGLAAFATGLAVQISAYQRKPVSGAPSPKKET